MAGAADDVAPTPTTPTLTSVSNSRNFESDGTTYHVSWATAGTSAYTSHAEDVQPQGELRLLHRDAAILVVDKPAFLPTENTATIKDSVRARVEEFLRQEPADQTLPLALPAPASLAAAATDCTALRCSSLPSNLASKEEGRRFTVRITGSPCTASKAETVLRPPISVLAAATVPAPTTAPAARRLTDDCAMAHGVYTSKRSVMAKLFHRFGITCERP